MSVAQFVSENKGCIIRTIVVYMCFFSFGLSSVSPGTALLDLQILIQESFSTTSRIITMKQMGYFCGGVMVGLLERFVNIYLTMAGCCAAFGLVTILTPLTTKFTFMATFCFIMGASQSIFEMLAHTIIIHLWKEKSTNSIQILHLTYAVGGLLCPVIIRPFMLPSSHEIVDNETEITHIHGLIHTPDEVQVHWPFLFIGILAILAGLCNIPFYIKPLDDNQKDEQDEDENKEDAESPSLVRQYIVCTFIAIMSTFSFPTWLIVGCFAQSYGVKSVLKLSKKSAALISSTFWFLFIVGRIFYIVLSIFMRRKILVSIFITILLIGTIVMASAAATYIGLMAGIVLIAFGVSPTSGLSISWPSKYFVYSGRQTSMIFLIGVIGESIHPIVLGYFFDDYPATFPYYLSALCGGFTLFFVFLPMLCKIVFPKKLKQEFPLPSETGKEPGKETGKEIGKRVRDLPRGSICSYSNLSRRGTIISLRLGQV